MIKKTGVGYQGRMSDFSRDKEESLASPIFGGEDMSRDRICRPGVGSSVRCYRPEIHLTDSYEGGGRSNKERSHFSHGFNEKKYPRKAYLSITKPIYKKNRPWHEVANRNVHGESLGNF